MFKNGLGRSDSYHIRMSSEWPTLILVFFGLEFVLNHISKNTTINKMKAKYLSIFIMVFLFSFNFEFKNLENLVSFKKNFFEYINYKDEKFLSSGSKNFLIFSRENLKKEDCVLNFTFDLSLIYLIKKPSCTKFIAPYLASGNTLEKYFIKDIKKNNPKYIIYKSPIFGLDSISMAERLKLVDNYIIKNFNKFYEKEDYVVLKKK